MAITNHERVGKALGMLTGGLKPFVERQGVLTIDNPCRPNSATTHRLLLGPDSANSNPFSGTSDRFVFVHPDRGLEDMA